ncbi:hypothetical protein AGDE_13118 [Angomonas deanei]|uniref:Uncharacterized protein n=1 Tax=Angomonas deanei TaxID=59799 RepID=A0A7G2CK93_9TRYP|nr:hypothetical protein AGDE_13118 [Angomonas deanei]CAD2218632.1 hypothetical protein, conserved [Angomonas deanei]|eukprot:EPY22791.1 hypothetical protein AGDE_13118 [Angomonas deanei]
MQCSDDWSTQNNEEFGRCVDSFLMAPLPQCLQSLTTVPAGAQEVAGGKVTLVFPGDTPSKGKRAVPIYEALLDKGRKSEEQKILRREMAIRDELSALQPSPCINLSGRSVGSGKIGREGRIEDKLLSRAKENETRWQEHVKEVIRSKEEKESVGLTFKPTITNKGKSSNAKFRTEAENYRNRLLQKRAEAMADQYNRETQGREASRGIPTISPHSRRLMSRSHLRSPPRTNRSRGEEHLDQHCTHKPEITRAARRAKPRYNDPVSSPRSTAEKEEWFHPRLNQKSVEIADSLPTTSWERLQSTECNDRDADDSARHSPRRIADLYLTGNYFSRLDEENSFSAATPSGNFRDPTQRTGSTARTLHHRLILSFEVCTIHCKLDSRCTHLLIC